MGRRLTRLRGKAGFYKAARARRRIVPSYLYECVCGQSYDVTHSIHDDPKITCDNCRGGMVRRPQSSLLKFNGSGFYVNDKPQSETNK